MLTFREYVEKLQKLQKPKEGSGDALQQKARADAIAKHNLPSEKK